MSSRLLIAGALVAMAVLLAASLSVMFQTRNPEGELDSRVTVLEAQPDRVQELQRHAEALLDADDRLEVSDARHQLAKTVIAFDAALRAVASGGTIELANGDEVQLAPMRAGAAADCYAEVARVWREIGPELADLAAGEFSVFSARGHDVLAALATDGPALRQGFTATIGALECSSNSDAGLAAIARAVAIGSGAALLLITTLLIARRRSRSDRASAPESAQPAPFAAQTAPTGPDHRARPAAPLSHSPPPIAAGRGYGPPENLDLASASVDRVAVDMNTIAANSAKMQSAIQSVAGALQGLLYSLNEMAQDTAEGSRLTRLANNAASYSADTVRDMVAASRDMGQIVGRVQELALRSHEIARQIETEAATAGVTSEAFTSVVAGEVQTLAQTANQATVQIEQTVGEMLTSQRHYEDAVGKILKNVGSINKVASNLGELMLDPPARVQPGNFAPPPVPQPVAQAASEPEPTAVHPEPTVDHSPIIDDEIETLAEETASILDALADPEPESEEIPAPPPEPEAASESPPETAPEPAPESVAEKDDDFELQRAKRLTPTVDEAATEPLLASEVAESEPLPPADESEPEPAPEAVTEPEPESVPEPVPVAAGSEPSRAAPVGEGPSGNIFILKKPKQG